MWQAGTIRPQLGNQSRTSGLYTMMIRWPKKWPQTGHQTLIFCSILLHNTNRARLFTWTHSRLTLHSYCKPLNSVLRNRHGIITDKARLQQWSKWLIVQTLEIHYYFCTHFIPVQKLRWKIKISDSWSLFSRYYELLKGCLHYSFGFRLELWSLERSVWIVAGSIVLLKVGQRSTII